MNRLTWRILAILVLCMAWWALNTYLVNGPMLDATTDAALQQFSGRPATRISGMDVGPLFLTMDVVYLGEVVISVIVGLILFYPLLLSAMRANVMPRS